MRWSPASRALLKTRCSSRVAIIVLKIGRHCRHSSTRLSAFPIDWTGMEQGPANSQTPRAMRGGRGAGCGRPTRDSMFSKWQGRFAHSQWCRPAPPQEPTLSAWRFPGALAQKLDPRRGPMSGRGPEAGADTPNGGGSPCA